MILGISVRTPKSLPAPLLICGSQGGSHFGRQGGFAEGKVVFRSPHHSDLGAARLKQHGRTQTGVIPVIGPSAP